MSESWLISVGSDLVWFWFNLICSQVTDDLDVLCASALPVYPSSILRGYTMYYDYLFFFFMKSRPAPWDRHPCRQGAISPMALDYFDHRLCITTIPICNVRFPSFYPELYNPLCYASTLSPCGHQRRQHANNNGIQVHNLESAASNGSKQIRHTLKYLFQVERNTAIHLVARWAWYRELKM